ncbi:hypothetical protein ACP70R_019522 [Stipagrostis hirtigluma subsp. patula]
MAQLLAISCARKLFAVFRIFLSAPFLPILLRHLVSQRGACLLTMFSGSLWLLFVKERSSQYGHW